MQRLITLNLLLVLLTACGRASFDPAAHATPEAAITSPALGPRRKPAMTPEPTLTLKSSASLVEFIGSITGEPNKFDVPTDIATDAQSNLYVLDAGHNRIQVFDSNGRFVTMWGKSGKGPGEFNFFRGDGNKIGALTLDAQGNVYVADNANQRVPKFDSQGKSLMEWGSPGLGDGQFMSPVGITVDQQGHIYVIDDSRDDAQKFDNSANFLLKWGSHGSRDGQLNYTGQLEADSQGNIYVAAFAIHRVEKFDSQGKFLAKWGEPGKQPGQFNDPGGIAIDLRGQVYVTEYAAHPPDNYRVQVFDGAGEFLETWGKPGIGNGEFLHPLAIAVDRQGNIYVSDETNRVQQFHLKER